MNMLSPYLCPAALLFMTILAGSAAGQAADETRTPCTEDAMIVFDASGSMAGNTVQGLFNNITRINEVRKALAQVLPGAAKFRKIGLITYGPGPYEQCNVTLDYLPMKNAAEPIMSAVNRINPAGKTPIVAAVTRAAEVLHHRSEKGVIVVLTDGEETCGGKPCDLGKSLKANSRDLTVHVIGYQLLNFTWTGYQSILDVKCLAEETGGLYITAETRQDLIEAFEKTLGCPMMSSVSKRVGHSGSSTRRGEP
jgi:Ca-activated chloride channel family protein